MMKAVIDTNVLVAALRSKRGTAFATLRALQERRFEFALSVPLFLEYEDVLKRPGMVPMPFHAIEKFLALLASRGKAQEIFFLWRPYLKDARDDMVLELAVAARCPVIVTFNQKDFVGVGKFGIETLTPFEFLSRLEREGEKKEH